MTAEDWARLEANPLVTIDAHASFLDAEGVSDQ